MAHATIQLKSGKKIAPVRAYRLRGGYRLLVTHDFAIWLEFERRYTLLANIDNWMHSSPWDATINRTNVCRIANFSGIDS